MGNYKHISRYSEKWLRRQTGRKFLWIWVDAQDRGLDIARFMYKLQAGEESKAPEVFGDSLPTCIMNGRTRAGVFILAQPNHADTALVSMNEGAQGSMISREVSPEEKEYYHKQYKNMGVADNPEVFSQLKADQTAENFQQRGPDEIIVDCVRPDWKRISSYLSPDTEVNQTDRVGEKYRRG